MGLRMKFSFNSSTFFTGMLPTVSKIIFFVKHIICKTERKIKVGTLCLQKQETS